MLWILLCAQTAGALDLVERLDDVDITTRTAVERSLLRGTNLDDLRFTIVDHSLPRLGRARALDLRITFERRWTRPDVRWALWALLSVDLPSLLRGPVSGGAAATRAKKTATV